MRKSISPLIILALACTAFAQTTPDVVAISAEDIAIVNALGRCNAGGIAVIRMSRNVTGSDSDPSYVAYFDVSMPRVVQ